MNISVAIPNSCLADESTRADKSRKASGMARTCAIFGTDTIYIYDDGASEADRSLLATILRYAETPPYLRRALFSKMGELKYAGVVSPLKIPSHTVPTNSKKAKAGDIREGVIVSLKDGKFVDVGLGRPLRYSGAVGQGNRTTVRLSGSHPELSAVEIPRSELKEYWGYIIRERSSLAKLLTEWGGRTILTSRKGKIVAPGMTRSYADSDVLVVFGSTERGLHEILGGHIKKLQNARILNFFPKQQTETVRLEEAMTGVLAILKAGL